MSSDTIKIQIDQSALDEAQAKADKLLATLQLIKEVQADLPIVAVPPLLAELQGISSMIKAHACRVASTLAAETLPSDSDGVG